MNSTCVFFLALALFGVFADAYVSSIYPSGCCGGIASGIGRGCCGLGGVGYGVGYGSGYGGSYGCGCGSTCTGACGGACAPTVCDTCQCVKTVVRPPCVERIPYSCSRRVQPSACTTGYGMYSGTGVGVYAGSGYGYGGYGAGYATNVVV